MTAAAQKVAPEIAKEKVLAACKAREGKATLGDIIVATGLSKGESESALRELLGEYESHLAVGEKGDILYIFEPSFLRRGSRERFRRALRALGAWLWKAFVVGFKVAIMVVLVTYFVLFVVLILSAIAAVIFARSNDNSSSSSSSSSHGGDLPIHWLFWFWGGPGYYGPYDDGFSGRRATRERAAPKDPRPFYKKVFSFVFGPEIPKPDPLQEERALLSWIRAMKGRITAADLASRTGVSLRQAEEDATRLIVDYGGDVEVSENGVLVYTFNDLLVEAGGKKSDIAPKAAYWSRFEAPLPLTGNTSGTNILISFLNGFTLLAALLAPSFLFPVLGFSSVAAWVGLFYFPLAFSVLFFAVPVFRALANARETRRRAERNLRRAALQRLYQAAEKPPTHLSPQKDALEIARLYERGIWEAGITPESRPARAFEAAGFTPDAIPVAAKGEVEYLLHHFDGEPKTTDQGAVVYDFGRLARELSEGEAARKAVRLQDLQLGKIVYRSDE